MHLNHYWKNKIMEFVAAINCGYQHCRAASHFMCKHLGFDILTEDKNRITINNGVLNIRLDHGDQDQQSYY